MIDDADTKCPPVITVHNHGADFSVMTSADRQQIDVMIGTPASIERELVCAWATTPNGDIEFSMLIFGQPQMTYTLSKLQARMIANALNQSCR